MGIRVDGKSCTRQKKRGLEYCGIHCPKLPQAMCGVDFVDSTKLTNIAVAIDNDTVVSEPTTKNGRKRRGGQVLQNKNDTSTNMVELVAEEIRGIIYYVDTSQRVYNIEDILDEKVDPRVIGKLITTETGQKEFCYTAPGSDSDPEYVATEAGTL
jgi:hypothetical protein